MVFTRKISFFFVPTQNIFLYEYLLIFFLQRISFLYVHVREGRRGGSMEEEGQKLMMIAPVALCYASVGCSSTMASAPCRFLVL